MGLCLGRSDLHRRSGELALLRRPSRPLILLLSLSDELLQQGELYLPSHGAEYSLTLLFSRRLSTSSQQRELQRPLSSFGLSILTLHHRLTLLFVVSSIRATLSASPPPPSSLPLSSSMDSTPPVDPTPCRFCAVSTSSPSAYISLCVLSSRFSELGADFLPLARTSHDPRATLLMPTDISYSSLVFSASAPPCRLDYRWDPTAREDDEALASSERVLQRWEELSRSSTTRASITFRWSGLRREMRMRRATGSDGGRATMSAEGC